MPTCFADDLIDSPFSQYLNTNYAPSDAEVHSLKRLIENLAADAVTLTGQIDEAQRASRTQMARPGMAKLRLILMRSRLAGNRQFIEEHTMLLAPIRRIPPDVLILIFQTFLESIELPSFPDVWPKCGSISRPSAVVSQVCAGWRSLALQTPTLWTHLNIRIPSFSVRVGRSWMTWCRKVDAQLLRVNAWINRAALCPIDLSLRIGGVVFKADNREDAIKRYEDLVKLLLPTSRRWQSVHFAWQVQFVTESVLKLFEEPQFPLLRKASFFVSAEKNGSATQHARARRLSRSLLFATPGLRDVTLTGYWENIAAAKASTSSLLYKSITHLSLDADSLDSDLPFDCSQALDVLKSLPNLISAKFSLHDSCPPLRPLSPPVHCPHLTSMTLESKPVSKGFGPSIYLPVLESLHFGYAPFHQAENPDLNGHEELLLQQGLPRCLVTLSNLNYVRCPSEVSQMMNPIGSSSESHSSPSVAFCLDLKNSSYAT
ncbi:hypothetical protein FA13DRAFT_1741400 [Coprinellus micaceus]|uniref:Uncharacterized protein n=1 Tax=Coprinellus micaceus TaxID=71717 RepID=A0A4Y7SJ56_COPMI|nr:hypothetical protein FA13DRAFT_1741400 [Coprinellus micaceus]